MNHTLSLFDTHAHLCSDTLWSSYQAVIDGMAAANVLESLVICQSCEELDRFTILQGHAKAHGVTLYACAGSGPHDDPSLANPLLPVVEEAASCGLIHAIGEIGLDGYHTMVPHAQQVERFLAHLELARRHSLPIVLHCRMAFSQVLERLDQDYVGRAGARSGLFHCFAEGPTQAQEVLARGFYISLSGIVTYPSAPLTHQVATMLPSDAYVVETDSPYLTPGRNRRLTNQPSNLPIIAQCVAHLRNERVEEVIRSSRDNARRFLTQLVPT